MSFGPVEVLPREFVFLECQQVPPTKYHLEDDHVSFALVIEIGDLDNYRKAIKADYHGKWITIVEQEMEFLNRNQAWTLVDLPTDCKAIVADRSFARKTMSNTMQD